MKTVKTECSIVRDLLPLYVENMVSEETAQYIKEHLKGCDKCQKEFENTKEGSVLPAIDPSVLRNTSTKPFKKTMKRLNRQIYLFAYSLIIFFIFLGFSWTGGENLMYNSIIMPVIGVFGYCVFRWEAVYKVPFLLLLIDLAVFASQLIEIGFPDTLTWTLIYSAFVFVGIVIAFLLHYAFKKEE